MFKLQKRIRSAKRYKIARLTFRQRSWNFNNNSKGRLES